QRPPLWFGFEDIETGVECGSDRWRRRSGENERACALDQVLNGPLRTCDECSGDSQSLSRGIYRNEDTLAAFRFFVQAWASISIDSYGMGFVDNQCRSQACIGRERCVVAVHAEQGFGNKKGFLRRRTWAIMWEHDALRAREPCAVDQARVVSLVGIDC